MLVRQKQHLFKPLCEARGIRSEATVSTKDLKTKLDRMEEITVVETFAPEPYREAHMPEALNIPPERIKELAP
jgi:rhodanese-related sulfurtransferase